MKVGSVVRYTDPVGVEHDALVTARFDGKGNDSAEPINPLMTINVVYISGDPAETDQYGRQLKRETSVQGKSEHTAHGRFWQPA